MLGIGDDPLDEDELAYVYEGRDQLVVPSMCVTLGWPPLWIAEPQTGIAWTKVLHGEQRFALHRPLTTLSSSDTGRTPCCDAERAPMPEAGKAKYWRVSIFEMSSSKRCVCIRPDS